MAKNDDMSFDFDAEMPSFDSSGGGSNEKKPNFFRDMAKGFAIGSVKKLGEYAPPAQETVESAAEMANQMRDQFNTVKTQANKIGSYAKGVSDDIKVVIRDIKEQKTLKDKLNAANKGIDKTKKNLAYAIDPEMAESFDFDKMMSGDDDFGSSSAAPSATAPSSTPRSDDSFIRERDAMLGIGSGEGSLGGINPSGSGVGGSKGGQRRQKSNIIINTPSGSDEAGGAALREAIIVSNAKIIANQNKLFKQQFIIDTKRHIQKMHALQQIADVTTLAAKFNAELLGPTLKQHADYMAKFQAQFTDMIDLARSEGASSESPIARALKGRQSTTRKNILDFTTASGGVNFGELYKHGTNQAKEMGSMYGLDMIGMVKDMLPMMLMGGDKTSIGKMLGSKLGGLAMSPFKKQVGRISEKMSMQVPAAMMKANEFMKESDNPLLQGLSELLNIDTGTKSTVDVSTKNRRVPFDMVTRKSIVEVIPGLLSDIHSAISGEEKKVFDHKTGQFTTASDMRTRLQSQIDAAGIGYTNTTKREMSNVLDVTGKKKPKDFEKDFDKIIRNMMTSGIMYDPNNLSNEKVKKFTAGLRLKEKDPSWLAFQQAWDGLSGSSKAEMHYAIQRGRNDRQRTLTGMETDMIEYGSGSTMGASIVEGQIAELERKRHNLSALEDGKNDREKADFRGTKKYRQFAEENIAIDKKINELKGVKLAAGGSGSLGAAAAASASPMTKIYELLSQGIYVWQRYDTPSHLLKIATDRKAAEAEKSRLDTERRKLAEQNESFAQSSSGMSAQLDQDERDENKRTGLEKLARRAGPLGTWFMGTGLGKKLTGIHEKGSKSKAGQFAKRVQGAISAGLDSIEGSIDKYASGNGFDVKAAAKDIIIATKGFREKGAETKAAAEKVAVHLAEIDKTHGHVAAAKEVSRLAKQGISEIINSDQVQGALTKGKEVLDPALTKLQDLGTSAKTKVSDIKNQIKENGLKATGANVIQNAKTKANAVINSDQVQGALTKGKEVLDPALTKLQDLGTSAKTKVSEFEKKAVSTGMAVSADAKQALNDLKSGKLDPVSRLSATFKLIGEKFNTALFGQYEDPKTAKMGIIKRTLWTAQEMMKKMGDFFLGQKDGKRWGLLYKLATPAMEFFENFRNKFMSRIGIPFKFMTKSIGRRMQWMLRDVKSNITFAAQGVMSKLKKGLSKLSKKKDGTKRTGVVGGLFKIAGGLTNFATKAVGGVVNAGAEREKKKLQQLVDSGKISQEEYDERIEEFQLEQDDEQARHNQKMEQIQEYQNGIVSKRFDPETGKTVDVDTSGSKKELSEVKGLSQYAKGMSYEERKADRARAKAKLKENKKRIKRGEKLTEEERMQGLTVDQLVDRKRDDMARSAKKALEEQAQNKEKESYAMEVKQTENSDKLVEKVETLTGVFTGSTKQSAPLIVHESALEDKIPQPEASSSPLLSGENAEHIDIKTGHEQGSMADRIADAENEKQVTANETVASALPEILTKLGMVVALNEEGNKLSEKNKKDEDKKETKLDVILKKVAGVGLVAGGGAMMTAGALPFAAAAHQGKNAIERTKRDGFFGGINELTGLDNQGDSDFDMDGNRKGAIQSAADRFKAGRFGVRGGYGKAAKLMGAGAKTMLKGAKKIAPKVVVDAATKAVTAILNSKVIKKYIGEGAIKQIAAQFAKKIGEKAAKSAAVQGAKKILGVLSGGIGLAIFAAADFTAGMHNAGRYFKLGPGEKVTLGMRVASGVAAALSGLAMGLIPPGWLAEMVYKIVATDTDKQSLDSAQARTRQRAEQLGVDPDKLNEVERRTLGQKFGDILPGGNKRRNKREATLLGMTPEEYEDWKKKRDAYDKGELAQSEDALAAQREIIDNKLATTGSGTSAEIKATGVINGYAAGQIAGGAGRNENFMDIPFLEKLAETDGSIASILPEARLIAAGERKEFSPEAKRILKFKHLPYILTVSKLDAQMAELESGVGITKAEEANEDNAGKAKKQKEKFDIIKSAGKLYAGIRNTVGHMREGLGKFVGSMAAGFTKAGLNIKKGFNYVASGKLKDDVFKKAGEIKDGVVGAVTGTFNAVKNALTSAFDYVKSGQLIEDIKNTALNAFNAVKDFIKNAFLSAVDGVKNFGKNIFEGAKNLATGAVDKVKSTASNISQRFSSGYEEKIDDSGRNLNFLDGREQIGNAARDAYTRSMGSESGGMFDNILNGSLDNLRSSLGGLTSTTSSNGSTVDSFGNITPGANSLQGISSPNSGLVRGGGMYNPGLVAQPGPNGTVNGAQIPFRDPNTFNQIVGSSKVKPSSEVSYLTQKFGMYTDGGKHYGIDIGSANEPQTINRATEGGEIVRVQDGFDPSWNKSWLDRNKAAIANRYPNNTSAYGNAVTVKTANGAYITYAHQEKNLVNEGQRVTPGQPLGIMGDTGNSLGKHLHLQISSGDKMHDPIEYLNSGRLSSAAYPLGPQSKEMQNSYYNNPTIKKLMEGQGPSSSRGQTAGGGGLEYGGGSDFATPVISQQNIPSPETPSTASSKPIEITNDVSADYLKNQNSKIAEALDLNVLIKHSEKMTGILHGDNIRVIQLLEQTYNLHNQTYEDASPMYAYYKQQNGPASSSHKRMSNALSKYTGGESTSQGLDIPMETAAT